MAMRRRHTRRTDPELAGTTVQRATRLPEVQLAAVRAVITEGTPDIHTVSDAIVDALWLWLYENQRVNGSSPQSPPTPLVSVPEPVEETPEPTEADHAYTGTQERPSWRDVDPSTLHDD